MQCLHSNANQTTLLIGNCQHEISDIFRVLVQEMYQVIDNSDSKIHNKAQKYMEKKVTSYELHTALGFQDI